MTKATIGGSTVALISIGRHIRSSPRSAKKTASSRRGSRRSVAHPDATVPITLKTPMAASSDDAVVAGMPWSWAAGVKWVHMMPLVDAPQIAYAPAISQKARVHAASPRSVSALRPAPSWGTGRGTWKAAP